MADMNDLIKISTVEFADIVKDYDMIDVKLRIFLINNSFIDIHLSQKLSDKFGFHWECRDEKGTIYRYDNFPDKSWEDVSTFPFHFHVGSQNKVIAAPFPLDIISGFRAFMEYVRKKIRE